MITMLLDPCMDLYVGDHVVVFAPYTRASLMRQYNMPTIWAASQRVLRDWRGLEGKNNVAIVVDRDCESSCGNPFKVPACQIKDPPAWGIGLNQIAANAIATGMPQLASRGELVGGLFYFNYPGGTGLMSGSVFGRTAGASAA